jgi:hypothetical protein
MPTNTLFSVLIAYAAFPIVSLILVHIIRQRTKKIKASLSKDEILQCTAINQSIPSYATLVKSLLAIAPSLVTFLALLYTLYTRTSFTILITILVASVAVEIITILGLSQYDYKKMIAFNFEEKTAKGIRKHKTTSRLLNYSLSMILYMGIAAVLLYPQYQ